MRITPHKVENGEDLIRALLPVLFLALSAATATPARAPVVRFTPIAKLEGFSLADFHGGWSPRAPLLVLMGREGGYYVWSATQPNSKPARLPFKGWVRLSSWSPAGDRILFVVGDPNPRNVRTLLVAKADGSGVDTLLKDVTFWPAMWAPDASIYYRSGDSLLKLESLKSWVVPPDVSRRKAAFLEGGGHVQIRRVTSDGREIDLGNPKLGGDIVSIDDEVLETDRYMLFVSGFHGGHYVVGAAGNILHSVRWSMSPNSISRDGELVVGGAGIVADDNSEAIDTLRIAHFRGNWCVPVRGAEDGADPQLARTDSLIAFNALHGGVIVGRYQIRSR